MSLYRITVTSVNGNSSLPTYPNPLTLNINEATLTWEYVAGNPPLPSSFSALEIIAVNVSTGQTERVRLGAPSLTVGTISGLQPNQTYDVQVVGYDVNNDPLAFSRPIRIEIPLSASQSIAFFPVLRIQRTLNYVDENYIQVTTNSSSESIPVVWAGISGATQWKVWYGIAAQGEYIDTNLPPQQTLSTTNTTILPNHSSGTHLYVLKIKAFNSNGNEIGTTRTYAFYWTIIVPDQPPPSPCSYQAYDITAQQNITNANHTISLLSAAGIRSIRIIASCPYSIVFSGNGWARLFNVFNTFTAGFDGNEDFQIHYNENTSAQSREASFVVRNAVNNAVFSITLRQVSSSSAPPCTYNITTNPPYNSVRPSDNAYIVVVSSNVTSIQVTVTTSNTCRYYFLDQFFQFSDISACATSACSGTNTVTLLFPQNTSTNVIERIVTIRNPDTNETIRRIVVRQLPPVTEYPLPNFVVPPTPYYDKAYLFDSNARYDIFLMHDGGSTIEVSMYSDRRGVIGNFGFQNFVKITATQAGLLPAANHDYYYWRLRDTRNTQMLYKTQRISCAAYNFPRAKFTAPTAREFFVPPNSGISITFEWTAVNWASGQYGLYMFSKNVLIADVVINNSTTYTYNFTRAQLESLHNNELYVELLTNETVTDQIVLRFENLPPPPPPPPPPPDDTQIMDVVEHIFPNQTLVSSDVAKSGFELKVWEIYGYDFATTVRREIKTWQSSDGSELRVITVAPDIEHTVQKSVLRSEAEFPSYTLQLTELFPVREVFKRFYEGQTNKPLMYYMRLTLTDDTGVYSVCEGVVRLPFETTIRKFKHHTSQGEVFQTKAFSVQLFHPASLLKFTNPIDQRSRTISYIRSANTITSSGKGLIDYIRNAFNSGVLIQVIDVFDVVMTWLNEASVLAKAGVFDSVRDTDNNPIYSPVVDVVGLNNALALLRIESDELNVAKFLKEDLLLSRIYIDSFLHSDSYGDPKTKQKSGELRDYSVELTRGLRDSKDKFPKEEKEFSFLNADNALEILQMLASSAHCNIYFDVRRIANTFRIIIVLERTGVQRATYLYNRSAGILETFYFARQQALTIENPHEQTLTNETLLVFNINVSEINGAGNEREDRSLARTELNDLLVYKADENDTLNAMMGAISVERRLALASVFATSYEFSPMNPDKIRRTLTLPSNRALEQHEREFYVRLAMQNTRASQSTLTFTQNNTAFTVQFYAPTWYIIEDASANNTILRFTGNVFVGRYFAEALYGYYLNKVRKSIKVLQISAFVQNALLFKEYYALVAQQRFGELAENTVLKPRHFRVDVVQGKIEGEFEVLDNIQVENDSLLLSVDFSIRYDHPPPSATSHRPRYTIPLRRTGYNYGAGTSIYGDGWKGYRLFWSIDNEYENYSIVIFRYINHTLQYIHEVALTERIASRGLEFGLTNYNIINTCAGRYVLVLIAHRTISPNPTVLVRKEYVVFDVDYGFLNVSVPHSLIHSLKDLAIQGAVRVQFAFAWFAGKDHIVTVMSSAPELDIGTALCVFVRDGLLHVGKFSVNKNTNTFNYSNVRSCDLSQVPAGGGVYNKVNVEIDIDNTANTAVFRINNTVYPSVGYAYSDSQFNISELTTLALNTTYFNVCVRDEKSAKVHGEYIRILRGNSFSSLTLAFEKYFDNDIGQVLVETEKGRVFVDEGKNIAKF